MENDEELDWEKIKEGASVAGKGMLRENWNLGNWMTKDAKVNLR